MKDLSPRVIEAYRGIMDLIPGGRRFVDEMKEIGRQHKVGSMGLMHSWLERDEIDTFIP